MIKKMITKVNNREILEFEDGSSSDRGQLTNSGNINESVREEEQINGDSGLDALFSQFRVRILLRNQCSLLLISS